MKPQQVTAKAGFLMVETIITFTLSALVLVGLVSAAAVLLRATDNSVGIVDSADKLGRTLAALRRDLSGMRRVRWNGEEPQAFVFRGSLNSLFFAQETPDLDGGRELRVVSLREIAMGRSTVLMRAEAHLSASATGWADLRFGSQTALPIGLARLRFRYVSEAVPGKPTPLPVDQWRSATTLPAALVIEAVDVASRQILSTSRIIIWSNGDIGCADHDQGRNLSESLQPHAKQFARLSYNGQNTGANPLFSLGSPRDNANNNEFCGRRDNGIAQSTFFDDSLVSTKTSQVVK